MSFRDRFFPLKPLTRSSRKPNIMAFDTEDNGTGAPDNFVCGCIYEGEEESQQHVFWSRGRMRRYIFKQHMYSTVAVAHNLQYDLNNIDYPEMTAERLLGRTKLIGAIYHYGDKKQMKILDTGNFFVGASIESLGKQLGYKKLGCKCFKSELDEYGMCSICSMFSVDYLRGINPYKIPQRAREHIEEYCMRDSEICYKTIQKLMDLTTSHKTRFKCFTAPSLAMRIYRTNHMKEPWKKRKMVINDIERLAYYGGRTEVFDYRFFEYVFAEDIRSSYPRAMRHELYPYPGDFRIFNHMPLEHALRFEGISLVTVDVPYMHIPPLPYRRGDGKLLFPIGTWTAAYTHPEIRMAIRNGVEILKCHESIIYPTTFHPFDDYVESFYQMKENTTGIDREFYKLLLNGLTGKYGEKRFETLNMRTDDPELIRQICQCCTETFTSPPHPGTNICAQCDKPSIRHSEVAIQDGWLTITGCRKADPRNAFPILIAYITAYGRIKLFEDRLTHGNNGHDIIYGDTDSAMSSHDFAFNRGPSLGDWEQQVYEGFMAYAPKYYDFGYKVYEKNGELKREQGVLKLKGVPKRHEIIYQCPLCFGDAAETPEKVWQTNGGFCCNCYMKLDEDNRRYKFERPLKLAEAKRRKMSPNTWVVVKKYVSKIDDKRTRERDGTSSPVRIYDDEFTTFLDLLDRLPRRSGKDIDKEESK